MPLDFLRPSSVFRFPGPRDRVTINGMTGSGKSTFALWLVSESADFDRKPWILIDYKGEDIISEIKRMPGVKVIREDGQVPTAPGIYALHPSPHKTDEMANWLWAVWRARKKGLFFDEVYMVPEFKGAKGSGGPLKAILTQGRSLEIPVYALAQRPVDVNRHVYTEASFLCTFRVLSRQDWDTVMDRIPDVPLVRKYRDAPGSLPPYNCIWFDVAANKVMQLRPSPESDTILGTFHARLEKLYKHRQI